MSECRHKLVYGRDQIRLHAVRTVWSIMEPSLAPDCHRDSSSDASSLSKSPSSKFFHTKLARVVFVLLTPFGVAPLAPDAEGAAPLPPELFLSPCSLLLDPESTN